jgi:hypothetical protein
MCQQGKYQIFIYLEIPYPPPPGGGRYQPMPLRENMESWKGKCHDEEEEKMVS